MVKSQRSSTTLFHQWPNLNDRQQSHNTPARPVHDNHHQHGSSIPNELNVNSKSRSNVNVNYQYQGGSSNRANNLPLTPIPTPIPSTPGIQNSSKNTFSVNNSPGSPSQTDPFGSQVTSPSSLSYSSYNHNLPNHSTQSVSTKNTTSSRPPSTVLSSGGSPLPGSTNSAAVTPKIILASPSTSTIHYLFPSSDTKNGIHLSTNTPVNSSNTSSQDSSKSNDGNKLKIGQSLSRGNSIKKRNNNNQIDQSQTQTQQQYREIPGLKNKRSLPNETLRSTANEKENIPKSHSSDLYNNKVSSTSNNTSSGSTTGLKKSDISKPYPSPSDEARDYSKGYYDVGPETTNSIDIDIMGTLRRQPGMIDLSGKSGNIGNGISISEKSDNSKVNRNGMRRRESIILKEIENRRERRGWEFGSKTTHNNELVDPPSPKSKTSANVTRTQIRGPNQKPYIPPITIIQQRRRSQSLTSPRPAPSPPIDPESVSKVSPLLPAPDLGDPLSLSVVIPSPSYSHLDYNSAGSSALSSSQSKRSIGWGKSKRASVVFPLSSGSAIASVAMSRGDTRKGLGSYESAKLKAQEDYLQRTSNPNGKLGRIASLKRSVSLRKKNTDNSTNTSDNDYSESMRKVRPRSQSLSSMTKPSRRSLEDAPPLPSPSLMRGGYHPYGHEYPHRPSSAYGDDLKIDLGSRYHPYQDNGSMTTLEMDLTSPRSLESSSMFPATTPSTIDFDHRYTHNKEAKKDAIRIVGKPLHPAFNNNRHDGNSSESELSILAPSTVGLGFSPVGTPVSLPDSLFDEMVDVTEIGDHGNGYINNNGSKGGQRRVSNSPVSETVITPPTPQNQGILPTPPRFLNQKAMSSASVSKSSTSSSSAITSTSTSSNSQSQRIPRRSLLLAQNRFYIPPTSQSKTNLAALSSTITTTDAQSGNISIQKKLSLRSSKSLGPNIMKRAYTSGNLKADSSNQPPSITPSAQHNYISSPQPSSNSTSFGRGLLKSASIRSTTKRFSRILENDNNSSSGQQQQQYQQYGTERISSTSSMKFNRRPLTTFSLCSPSDAIEPLPLSVNNSPSISISSPNDQYLSNSNNNGRSESKTVRSNKSNSPFLSASNSLRVIFGKEGFVARSLSQAFDKDPHNSTYNQSPDNRNSNSIKRNDRERSSSPKIDRDELKLKISSPLEASPNLSTTTNFRKTSMKITGKNEERKVSSYLEEESKKQSGRNSDKKWRESVLQEALTISISNSSSLNKLANTSKSVYDDEEEEEIDDNGPKMVSSGSKSRLAIPDLLLSAPNISENRDSLISNSSEGFKGIGENMLRNNTNNNSLESSLNLRAVMEDWQLPLPPQSNNTRSLGVIGKEESMMSAPSMYSNNASTYFEKPTTSSTSTRRLQGKGLPSSFSIADLTKRSISSKSKGKLNLDESNTTKNKDLKKRIISPPIPIKDHMLNSNQMQTFDLSPRNIGHNDHIEELLDSNKSKRNMNNSNSMREKNLSTRSSIFGLRTKSPEPYSSHAITNGVRSVTPDATSHVQISSSRFGLSLRSSLRSKSKSSIIVNNGGISSNDIPQSYNHNLQQQPLLDSLLARDIDRNEEVSQYMDTANSNSNSNSKDKLRKVLEWRDEVGENEQFARLEQKMRGFVNDERERVIAISRKSIEG
ncbi:uncharacterized protein L201_003996 [Kwoniella dendrophila CBS 6074]|uniref:Uncharacterized protein n=1 Tax=Kwoniella dendrophila CBS 6074 TaxID=1295534 RepID=A0AAX4JW22_9TREE